MKIFMMILMAILPASLSLMAQNTGQNKSAETDSLFSALNTENLHAPVTIFKSTRLILSQSVETVKKNNFNFEIIHRFGDFAGKNGGGQYFYGLDDIADVALRFEYGISDNLNADLERSMNGGLVNLELKYAALHQAIDASPLAVTFLADWGAKPYGSFQTFDDRVSYFAQVIFARKFSSLFSLQVAPAFLRDNTPYPLINGIEQQFFSVSAAATIKITTHTGIIIDYAHPFSHFRKPVNGFYDPIGFGFEIETGGHVFTVNITNARAISEINYLSNTQSDYFKGMYRIGFTISRMFDFNHKERYK
jgi:hypothetical protein